MTIEQALKINQNWTAEQARNDLERLLLRDERPANKVIALACKALEKQIPKKLTVSEEIYCCPRCGENAAILHGDKYCFNCGQALDWEVEQNEQVK